MELTNFSAATAWHLNLYLNKDKTHLLIKSCHSKLMVYSKYTYYLLDGGYDLKPFLDTVSKSDGYFYNDRFERECTSIPADAFTLLVEEVA